MLSDAFARCRFPLHELSVAGRSLGLEGSASLLDALRECPLAYLDLTGNEICGVKPAGTEPFNTYVLKMVTVPGKDAYLITTPTLTGGTKDTEVLWADVTRPIGYHPFGTFEAAGKKFYLDELGDMHDESFPAKLEAALNA